MALQDELLIRKAQKGDISAFEELILSYEKKIYNITYRMTGNVEDAMDLSQESLLKIYKSLKKFKYNSSFSTWVYRITMNTCLDEIRKRKKQHSLSLNSLQEQGDRFAETAPELSPETAYERKERLTLLEDAINNLIPEYKSVIVLRDIQGFSYDEIADILNCSLGTVKSRINRARNELKQKLSGNGNI